MGPLACVHDVYEEASGKAKSCFMVGRFMRRAGYEDNDEQYIGILS